MANPDWQYLQGQIDAAYNSGTGIVEVVGRYTIRYISSEIKSGVTFKIGVKK